MLAEHKQTKVIVMYLEDMGNGQEFLKVCKYITRKKKKPVLVLKSGRSPEGAKAAMSHTGALMGSDEIYDALRSAKGVVDRFIPEFRSSVCEIIFCSAPFPS